MGRDVDELRCELCGNIIENDDDDVWFRVLGEEVFCSRLCREEYYEELDNA